MTTLRLSLLALVALASACGPLPPGSEPVPLVERPGGGPAMPDYRGDGSMGLGGANGGMGIGGGVQAGGGPAIP